MSDKHEVSAGSEDRTAAEEMQVQDVRRVAIVGAGTMGQQIAFQCAAHGYEVTIFDIAASALESALGRIDSYAEALAAHGEIDAQLRASAQTRISFTADLATAVHDADLLSECVFEDPELKGRVLAQCNAHCPPRTIFMTNTSSLVASQFAAATGRADRLLALHFHNPIWVNNLVDVMPHPGTAPEVTELVTAFASRIGQVVIELQKEHSGYVFNSMYSALNSAAITLAAQGVASIEDIDRSWMHIWKVPVGPLGALDGVGLDTVYSITAYWAKTLGTEQLKANAAFLKEYVDRGDLGVKTGRGFYDYPDPAYAQPGFIRSPQR
jgi:3-hydroxybutyryl-CoA dehydrogenase